MKSKTIMLTMLALLQAFVVYAQRNPSKEILVFFKEGVQQETKIIKGQSIKSAKITSNHLKILLKEKGIEQTMLKLALPDFIEKDTVKILPDGRIIKRPNMSKLYRFKIPEAKTQKEFVDALNNLPEVLYAEPNGMVSPLVIPSDTRFIDQWGLRNTINPGADIHAEQAWDIYTGNPNNIIAIIDGGTDTGHEDLNSKIAGGDTGWGWGGHGIHVSGIAAAESNNAQGVSGVDWQAQIHPQRVDNLSDYVDTYQAIVDAVDFSSNVHVLNHSWGLENPDGSPAETSITINQAFAYAYKANRTSLVAMGNHQLTDPNVVAFPAGFNNVIAVGATNIADNIANFSAQGNHIDVSAPGVGILSTFTGGGYDEQDGTSMATPFVSGIASLLKGFNPSLANDDIEQIIRLSADDRGVVGFDAEFGTGRVNAEQALQFLQAPFALQQWTASGGTITSSTSNFNIQFLDAQGIASGNYIVKRHEVHKTITFPQSFCDVTGVWGRGVFTTGWSQANPNYGEGFCDIVPGTQTNTGATLRTYVYEVFSVLGQPLGFYPTTPANVTFAYSVLGIPNPNSSISGSSTVCTTNSTFTLQNLPAGATVSWSVSPTHLFAVDIGSGASFTTRATNSSSSGAGTITATINGSCVTVTEDVWVGKPQDILGIDDIAGPDCIIVGQFAYYHGLPWPTTVPGADSYEASIQMGNPTGISMISSSNRVEVKVITAPWTPVGFRVMEIAPKNACGYGSATYAFFDVQSSSRNCGGMGGPQLSVSPNPVNNELDIKYTNKKTGFILSNDEFDVPINYVVTDSYGTVVFTKNSKETSHKLNLRRIRKGGIYILSVDYGNELGVEQIRLVIER